MMSLVYVHAYNLHPRDLLPWTPVEEPFSATTYLQYFLANGLLRFRIPILFAISGYLFAHKDGSAPHIVRVLSRVRTLVIPFVAWCALGLIFVWMLEQFATTRQLVLAANIVRFDPEFPLVSNYTPKQVLLCFILAPVPFQLWFIRSLFIYNLCYPWLRTAVDRVPRLYFAVAGVLWLTGWVQPRYQLVEGSGLLFFAFGIWLRRRNVDVQTVPSWFRPWPLLGLWLALIGVKTGLAFYLKEPPVFLMSILYRTAELLGIFILWFGTGALVRGAMRQAWFIWLTSFSFIIYAMHEPLFSYVSEGVMARWPDHSFLVFALLPPVVIAAVVGVGALLRRLAPGVYALLTGGRGVRRTTPAPRPWKREGVAIKPVIISQTDMAEAGRPAVGLPLLERAEPGQE